MKISKIWKIWVSVFWASRVVRGGLPSRNAAACVDIWKVDARRLQFAFSSDVPFSRCPGKELAFSTPTWRGNPRKRGSNGKTSTRRPWVPRFQHEPGGSRNCLHLSRQLCRHSPLRDSSCDRRKRQPNKGGACHAATTAEAIRYVQTSAT